MDTILNKDAFTNKRGTNKERRCSKSILILALSALLLFSQFLFTDNRSFTFNSKTIPRPAIRMQAYIGNTSTANRHFTSINLTSVGISKHLTRVQPYRVKSSKFHRHTSFNFTSAEIPKNLTKVGTGQFFIFTVVAEQSLSSLKWNSLMFIGWEERLASSVNYMCCLQYYDGQVTSRITSEKRLMWNKGAMVAKQIVCNVNNTQPVLAGLVLANQSCVDRDTVYLQPVYRKRDAVPKFAICAKIAYGEKSAKELVEWMEYHMYYGASPVVIYPYEDLNHEAYKVLHYYATQGQLEMVPLPRVPRLDKYSRHFRLPGRIKDQDEQVPNFDAQERLRPYKYFTVMDTDEFIAPKHRNITSFVQLMDYLLSKQKNAATFRLLTEIHLLNWEKTGTSSDLTMAQFGYHTQPVRLTQKHLHVTERIQPGTVWIHDAKPVEGFVRAVPDANEVVLKHFRSCKQLWFRNSKVKKPCLDHFKKIRGHFMEDVAKEIRPNIIKVQEFLELD